MRGSIRKSVLAAIVLSAVAAPGAECAVLSKKYVFKGDVTLEVGATTAEGVRLDGVRFTLPATHAERFVRSSGLLRAEVTVTNTTTKATRIGLAIALHDDAGRLLGVASAGNKLRAIKPGAPRKFQLIFDGVNAEAGRATTFQISIEGK